MAARRNEVKPQLKTSYNNVKAAGFCGPLFEESSAEESYTMRNTVNTKYTNKHLLERGVMVIVVGNGYGDTSSKPG